jgi:fructose-specific phosphotransferase system IIC component
MSKKVFIIIGFIAAILAVILAVTPLSNLAIAPIIAAFLSGLVVLFLSKKHNTKTKTIQYIFLLVIISLGLTIYKGVFLKTGITNTEPLELLEQLDKENLKGSKEILEDKEIEENF